MLSRNVSDRTSYLERALRKSSHLFIIAGALSGMLILLKIEGLRIATRLVYAGFDITFTLIALSSLIALIARINSDKEM